MDVCLWLHLSCVVWFSLFYKNNICYVNLVCAFRFYSCITVLMHTRWFVNSLCFGKSIAVTLYFGIGSFVSTNEREFYFCCFWNVIYEGKQKEEALLFKVKSCVGMHSIFDSIFRTNKEITIRNRSKCLVRISYGFVICVWKRQTIEFSEIFTVQFVCPLYVDNNNNNKNN